MSDDFLSRWSRRKRAVEVEERPEPPVEPEGPPAPEGTDEEILAALGLKHPDDMQAGDDFAAFLRAAVPAHLKTLALRRLWRSNPTLACLDGLNDYDTDFTGGGVPKGSLKTAYQVGRGIVRQVADVAERDETSPQEPDVAEDPEAEEPAVPSETAESMQTAETVQENDAPRATRRRMVFRQPG